MYPMRKLLESVFVRMCSAYDMLPPSVQAEGCGNEIVCDRRLQRREDG